MENNKSLFCKIPSFDLLIKNKDIENNIDKLGKNIVVNTIRQSAIITREKILNNELNSEEDVYNFTLNNVLKILNNRSKPFYRKAINATGIILHTALGRAVLPKRALEQINSNLDGYALLQYDQESGKRGEREFKINSLLQELTNCESATVVNNNAAATIIALNAAAKGKEVIVSRGQLVEIGGAFRLPDIMAISGVIMREVGTTNKTHLRDYKEAINENTAAILRVHPSNYQINGFTQSVNSKELCDLAHEHNLCFINDIGAGSLIDFSRYGFMKEPTLKEEIEIGSDIVTCSGDKLINSVQSGLILGKKEWIDKISKNALHRALRVDKITLGALEATLSLFLDEKLATKEIPSLKMLIKSKEELTEKAREIINELRCCTKAKFSLKDDYSQMGSGSLPEQNLPTSVVAIETDNIEDTIKNMRNLDIPIIARIKDNRILIDPRTLLEGEQEILINSLKNILK